MFGQRVGRLGRPGRSNSALTSLPSAVAIRSIETRRRTNLDGVVSRYPAQLRDHAGRFAPTLHMDRLARQLVTLVALAKLPDVPKMIFVIEVLSGIVVNAKRERYFCTEDEAVACGWRKPGDKRSSFTGLLCSQPLCILLTTTTARSGLALRLPGRRRPLGAPL